VERYAGPGRLSIWICEVIGTLGSRGWGLLRRTRKATVVVDEERSEEMV
jgi:hypothetical protein